MWIDGGACLSIPAHYVGLISLGVVCLVITIEPWGSSIGHAPPARLINPSPASVLIIVPCMEIAYHTYLPIPTHHVS